MTTFSFPESAFVPLAVGFFGLGTGLADPATIRSAIAFRAALSGQTQYRKCQITFARCPDTAKRLWEASMQNLAFEARITRKDAKKNTVAILKLSGRVSSAN